MDKLKKEADEIKKQFAKQILTLVTSGFGLVAALAWNEVIKEIVDVYIKPFFGEGSGLVSLFIYALFVTVLVVIVTYQLSKIVGKDEEG
ncbi:MAG: hypothetical protein US53_C0065G0005 [Candidatus Woesebacteria bacterium GW2011_GWA1_37_7]|uniref:Large-conductance mechanosensitive channel-like protein n=2 Tax=Candidatus Woeseibacteriota TaxID=1752722 RepID=A0A0G0HBY1_9BACT|nr:MAG: hypothetical protein US53_C0065G0005 [Candidatus Woesebacteria bacterium GW2011_GWA1_37_7]OGM19502.1 MAG: hypothetical protein A2685_00600 [Candidatus Woesebacteria bacterium RIFCSPHIGHO2_01_FULL_37_10]